MPHCKLNIFNSFFSLNDSTDNLKYPKIFLLFKAVNSSKGFPNKSK